MKKYGRKLTAGLLSFAMTASTFTPAFAAPVNTEEGSSEVVLSQTAEANIAAAKVLASLGDVMGTEEKDTQGDPVKEKIKDWIFNGYKGNLDLSRFGITSENMDTVLAEVLEETNLEGSADVTYQTDDEGQVTTAEVEMDPMVVMAAEELAANANVYNLTEEQSQELVGMYSRYLQLCKDNADIFGVQVPYNTTRDTNASPIGALLDVAGVPEDAAQAGYVDYDTLYGIVSLYYLGTSYAVSEYADEIKAGRNEALSVLKDGMTDMQEYLALNSWLADNCQFAMDYIMEEMVEPEPAENKLYTYAYNCVYNMMYQKVQDAAYNEMVNAGLDEDTAKNMAKQVADAYMVDVEEEKGSGEQQAAQLASMIVGMWGSNPVGVFVNKKAVCFGYANVFAYLLQCAHPEIYLKDGATDIDTADNWKSYEELNYELDSDGNPVKDENGNYKWSKDSAAIADYVKIIFDANVSMFGEKSTFGETHYWNAVKLDGKWYYVDPCYVDIYVECMNRDRVETDGNLNHLYFMFSDTSCREMYDDNYKEIRTLYKDIATDQTYEEAWVAFVKSQPRKVDDRYYYLYDSTNLLSIMREYGGSVSETSRAARDSDYDNAFTDTEYKIVYHTDAMGDTSADFSTLIDFNNGQVYVPGADGAEGSMTDNALIAELYAEHEEYVKEYPSISISCAYYDGKIYFSLSNCILSYDVSTGDVEKLIEYTEVSGDRDMSNGLGGLAFTMTNSPSNDNSITVKNPPIADMTIKEDGKMYVSVATTYAFISGKDFGQLKDYSSYGYKFAETNYEPSYNTYYNNSEPNDNDEFMWSANIVGTIDMSHLTGTSHSYKDNVTVPASCTEDEYTVSRCSDCGLLKETTVAANTAKTVNAEEGETNEDVTPKDGEDDEKVTATLAIEIKDGAGEDAQLLKSGTLTADGVKDGKHTFAAADIQAKAEEVAKELSDDYTLDAYEYEDVEVAYGTTETVVLTASKESVEQATATLSIEIKDGTGESAQLLKTGTLTADGAKDEKHTFAAADIQAKAEEIAKELSGGYILDAYEYKDVEVAYGATETVSLTASKEKATATLNIKVYDSATYNADNEEDKKVLLETKAEKEGPKDETCAFTADDIKKAIGEINGYTLDESSLPTENISVVYGGEAKSVEVKATEIPTGAGHTYIKFNETYYTKDSNDNWQTGTSYVCIDCGHAFELEDDETVEDHLRSNDKVLTDNEVKSYAGKTTEVWTWSTDKTQASMYTVPTDLKDHKFDCIWENPSLSTREVATVSGDCTTGKFTATLSNGKTSTASVTAGNHSYQKMEKVDGVTKLVAVQWTWDKKCTTATATFTCDVCGKTLEKTVQQADMDSAKTDDGLTKYTATVKVDGVNYTSSSNYNPNPFEDVSKDSFYYDAVLWAVKNDITSGKDDTHFAPNENCTRAQVVTFLWRAMDEPEPKATENPFVDVKEDKYYYKAVLWAAENGITAGIDETHFAPNDTVTRGQFVTFLHRNEGEPKPTITENPFVDVNENKYYYNAVLWAYENGITKGTDETHFEPESGCTRGQVVTFLYRAYGDEK